MNDIPTMTPGAINIAIAEELGWTTRQGESTWYGGLMLTWHITPDGKQQAAPPNYATSLDACATFEATLTATERCGYRAALRDDICATASQRAAAFLLVKGRL